MSSREEGQSNLKVRAAWKLHLVGGLGILLCVIALSVETVRAFDGNGLSWVYVIEWPILGGFGVYLWRQLLRDYRGERPARDAIISALEAASRSSEGLASTEESINRD